MINIVEDLEFVPNRDILVTMDITSLYSNIPIDEAIRATDQFIDKHNIDCPKSFVIDCLYIVLTENIIEFGDSIYRQLRGVSMGASVAPSIANIYMSAFEDRFIDNEVAPFFESISHWSRYIDDIFFIWTNGNDSLLEFLEWINLTDENLHFTAQHSTSQVEFLDLLIRENNNKLEVDLYVKSTARNTLLHFSSFHPKSQRESIPFSQFLRVRRNCTNLADYDKQASIIRKKFLERGYPHRLIRSSYKRARFFDRDALLTPKEQTVKDQLVCVTTHSTLNERIRQIINASWHLLNCNPTSSEKLPKPLFAFKRNKNLKDKIVHSRFNTNISNNGPIQRSLLNNLPVRGTVKCSSCKSCNNIIGGEEFTHNGYTTKANDLWNCNTTNVIYFIRCVCGLGYVGETCRSIQVRITEHRSAIRTHKVAAPLVKHFLEENHKPEDFQWRILEKIRTPDSKGGCAIRKKREVFWIFVLNTYRIGLNCDIPWENAIM
ncbi:uncharacterized protein LOC144798270 [Lissotriton helveticus]